MNQPLDRFSFRRLVAVVAVILLSSEPAMTQPSDKTQEDECRLAMFVIGRCLMKTGINAAVDTGHLVYPPSLHSAGLDIVCSKERAPFRYQVSKDQTSFLLTGTHIKPGLPFDFITQNGLGRGNFVFKPSGPFEPKEPALDPLSFFCVRHNKSSYSIRRIGRYKVLFVNNHSLISTVILNPSLRFKQLEQRFELESNFKLNRNDYREIRRQVSDPYVLQKLDRSCI
jgi:hypothetical protein